jgi:hypothetical protein
MQEDGSAILKARRVKREQSTKRNVIAETDSHPLIQSFSEKLYESVFGKSEKTLAYEELYEKLM